MEVNPQYAGMRYEAHPWFGECMAGKVNLDAMIRRQDFNPDTLSGSKGEYDKFHVHDLTYGSPTLSRLRKPEFQRETNAWDPKQVLDLISSFVSEDLVPAVILWRSADNFDFVIDGAHRLKQI